MSAEQMTAGDGRCGSCRFAHINWHKGDKFKLCSSYTYEVPESERHATSVQCRRHAPRGPVVIADNHYETTPFPWLDGDDWCGDYQPRAILKEPNQ